MKKQLKTLSGAVDKRSKAYRLMKAKNESPVRDTLNAQRAAEVPIRIGGTGTRGTYVPLDFDGLNDSQVGGSHYTDMAVQPWDAMGAWLGPQGFQAYLRGNAIKYLSRCHAKGGLEDIKKAGHYIAKLIEVSEG